MGGDNAKTTERKETSMCVTKPKMSKKKKTQNGAYRMKGCCCVCERKAEGLIVCDEFVCFRCNYEATGELPPKEVSLRQVMPLRKRRQIRESLITEHLINKTKEKFNEQREADN